MLFPTPKFSHRIRFPDNDYSSPFFFFLLLLFLKIMFGWWSLLSFETKGIFGEQLETRDLMVRDFSTKKDHSMKWPKQRRGSFKNGSHWVKQNKIRGPMDESDVKQGVKVAKHPHHQYLRSWIKFTLPTGHSKTTDLGFASRRCITLGKVRKFKGTCVGKIWIRHIRSLLYSRACKSYQQRYDAECTTLKRFYTVVSFIYIIHFNLLISHNVRLSLFLFVLFCFFQRLRQSILLLPISTVKYTKSYSKPFCKYSDLADIRGERNA